MIGVGAGCGDRLTLGVLPQYRIATTEQMHRVIAPEVRIERTRRRLARLRAEGLVDRITLPQAGRTRVGPLRRATRLRVAEMRGHRPSRTVPDPTALRLWASFISCPSSRCRSQLPGMGRGRIAEKRHTSHEIIRKDLWSVRLLHSRSRIWPPR
ncbi:replication-relaxation family protein [Streptomyces diastatochromogenes]|uniref:replication-relaxation family protein n=1 Tax=Streptomyces diastatochromogenes TaxID=42236 RepID=UPI00368C9E97